MKNRFNKKMLGRVLTVALVLFALTPVLAQGAAAISNANTEIRKYWDPIKLMAIRTSTKKLLAGAELVCF